MKAAFFKEHGAEKIAYGDYRDPVPEAGEVVVRVKACALNQVGAQPSERSRVEDWRGTVRRALAVSAVSSFVPV
jgi:hypothetical protein